MQNTGNAGFGTTGSPSGTAISPTGTSANNRLCEKCGGPVQGKGFEQVLGKLGLTEEMLTNLRTSMQDINVEEYINTAREYLKESGDKAKSFTKENPGKVAAGVAVLAVGVGLMISAMNRD